MNSLQIPNRLTRDPHVLSLMARSEESLPLALGRLLLMVDYHARINKTFYLHDQIDEIVKWERFDLHYSECLEFAKLGFIENDKFHLKLPPQWVNEHKHWKAAKIRASKAVRNELGRFVSKKEKVDKPVLCDAEGNEI